MPPLPPLMQAVKVLSAAAAGVIASAQANPSAMDDAAQKRPTDLCMVLPSAARAPRRDGD